MLKRGSLAHLIPSETWVPFSGGTYSRRFGDRISGVGSGTVVHADTGTLNVSGGGRVMNRLINQGEMAGVWEEVEKLGKDGWRDFLFSQASTSTYRLKKIEQRAYPNSARLKAYFGSLASVSMRVAPDATAVYVSDEDIAAAAYLLGGQLLGPNQWLVFANSQQTCVSQLTTDEGLGEWLQQLGCLTTYYGSYLYGGIPAVRDLGDNLDKPLQAHIIGFRLYRPLISNP